MFFEIVSEITSIEVIAKGRGVRSRNQLSQQYGHGRWRKLKGTRRSGLRMAQSNWRRFIGMKRQASAKKTSKSNGSSASRTSGRLPRLTSPKLRFVVCIDSGGYVDLEPLKVYRVCPDREARTHGMLRVVDASGEDYLYPATFFSPIQASSQLFQLVKQ